MVKLTNSVGEFANSRGAKYVFGAQKVGDEAADDHEKPHDKVRKSSQQAVLHSSTARTSIQCLKKIGARTLCLIALTKIKHYE